MIKSTIELLCLSLLVLDLFLFKIGALAAASLAYFVFDFIKYRFEAVSNYRESKNIRDRMTLGDIRSIEKKYSLRDDFNSFEKHGAARPPLERYF